jgi:hypothetical protein
MTNLWEMWKKGFDAWENATAQHTEQLLKSPWLLGPSGAVLGKALKLKAARDRAAARCWGALGLPSRRDQERTLHALNQIQSRLLDLEERLGERE